MSTIQFKMTAYTGAAGKYDPNASQGGNEDNFYVDDNLCDEVVSHFETDAIVDLSELGMIMAVADGMGGMNAGEVASQIAVDTVKDFFAPGKVTKEMASTDMNRRVYLESLVVEADKRIKEDGKVNEEHEGLGSTIIIAWMVGHELTITWCGDSRAYLYRPNSGIELISEDHSYVQDLVKKGMITYEDTFGHPQGNIITRSLGDSMSVAQPESRCYNISESDIILLCSDGLSGVLRDKPTRDCNGNIYPGDTLEDIIKTHETSMSACKDALWDAAEKADWYDNVTILLCQVVKSDMKGSFKTEMPTHKKSFWNKTIAMKRRSLFWIIGGVLLVSVGLILFNLLMHKEPSCENENIILEEDTLAGDELYELKEDSGKYEMIKTEDVDKKNTNIVDVSRKESRNDIQLRVAKKDTIKLTKINDSITNDSVIK